MYTAHNANRLTAEVPLYGDGCQYWKTLIFLCHENAGRDDGWSCNALFAAAEYEKGLCGWRCWLIDEEGASEKHSRLGEASN